MLPARYKALVDTEMKKVIGTGLKKFLSLSGKDKKTQNNTLRTLESLSLSSERSRFEIVSRRMEVFCFFVSCLFFFLFFFPLLVCPIDEPRLDFLLV